MSPSTVHPVAVVGLAAIMPDAPTGDAFWANVKGGKYSISEVPPERWDRDALPRPRPRRPRQDLLDHRGLGPRVRVEPDRLAAARAAHGRRADGRGTAMGGLGGARRPHRRRVAGLGRRRRPRRGGARQRHRRREALRLLDADPPPRGDPPARGVTHPADPSGRHPARDRRRDALRLPRQHLRDHRGHDAGGARQRHGRPHRQPVRPARAQLHHRRGLRLRPGGPRLRRPRARRAPVRRRRHRRGRPQHGRRRVRQVLQDRRPLGHRHPTLRRRRRRLRHGRGRRAVRAQASRGRRGRRGPHLRGRPRGRRLLRRQGQGDHRAQPGRPAARRAPGLGQLRRGHRDRHGHRGPRHLDPGGRRRRADLAHRGLR